MPEVEFAQPNYRYTICATPNDPSFLSSQWSLHSPTAGINVTSVWDHVTGNTNIVIAVIDTGVNYNHPDLKANMWVNPNPSPGTNDIHGARWTNTDGTITSGNPMDDHAHGSHVAGIIGAVGNNGIGIAGVCWNASIMALKAFRSDGRGEVADIVAAIEYAVDNGAMIINASFGGAGGTEEDENDIALRKAIDKAGENGILFVAAAGNSTLNLDVKPYYPASFPCANLIAVANHQSNGNIAGNSCYGSNTVHLTAPGTGIYSTRLGNTYASGNGTSYAAPHVVGAAALLWAVKPQASMAEVRQALLDGAEQTSYWQTRVICGKLSVQGAVDVIVTPIVAPDTPAPVSLRVIAPDMVELSADIAPPAGTRHCYDILTTPSLQAPVLWKTNRTVYIFRPTDGLPIRIPVDPAATSGFFKAVPRVE